MRRALVALLAASLVGGCSPAPDSAPAPEPLRIARTITARELPSSILKSYKLQMPEHETGGGTDGYRAGTLDTEIVVYETQAGEVFVDREGGGHMWARSCEAINEVVHRNGLRWGRSCVQGVLEDF
jgi:hypothetical protein